MKSGYCKHTMRRLELGLDAKTCTTQVISTRNHLQVVGCKCAIHGQCPSMPKFCRLVQQARGAPSQLQGLLNAPVWSAGILFVDEDVLRTPLCNLRRLSACSLWNLQSSLSNSIAILLTSFAFRLKSRGLPACLPCSGIRVISSHQVGTRARARC